MIEHITADRIANSIILRKEKYENFILVEGSHDRLFLLKFKSENSQIEITFGWEKLLEVVKKLKERGYENILGIIDLDFREFVENDSIEDDNVIITYEHDINIMCIEKSFSLIFDSYCSEEKIDGFKKEHNINCIKKYTYDLLKPLSYLKVLNKRENLHLTFKSNDRKKNNFDYTKFIDKNKFILISVDKLIETVTNFSRGKTSNKIISNEKIFEKLEKILKNESFDEIKLSSGHDFGEVICLGLKKVLGSKEIDSETFLKECILSYDSSDFKKSKLYSDIKKMQTTKRTKFINL